MAYDSLTILDASGVPQAIAYKDDSDPRVQAVAIDVDGLPASATVPLPVSMSDGIATISGTVAHGIPVGATAKRKQLVVTTLTGSTDLWDPDTDKRIALQTLLITCQPSATPTRVVVWEGTNADTTYSGTEPTVFDHEFPAEGGGAFLQWPENNPWTSETQNNELHVTTDANNDRVFISANGYEQT